MKKLTDIEAIIKGKEGKTLEFKRDLSSFKPIMRTLIAFANTAGGRTTKNRPLHAVCAYSEDEQLSIVITVYQPNPERWIDFSRRKK